MRSEARQPSAGAKMKARMWVLSVAFCLFLVEASMADVVITSAKAEPDVVTAGQSVKITVMFDVNGAGEEVFAYLLGAHGNSIPAEARATNEALEWELVGPASEGWMQSNKLGWGYNPNKKTNNYKGGGYTFSPNILFDDKEKVHGKKSFGDGALLDTPLTGKGQILTLEIETENWPEGDYGLAVAIWSHPPNSKVWWAEVPISIKKAK